MEKETMTEEEFMEKSLRSGYEKETILSYIEEAKLSEKKAKKTGEPCLPLGASLALSYECVFKHKPHPAEISSAAVR